MSLDFQNTALESVNILLSRMKKGKKKKKSWKERMEVEEGAWLNERDNALKAVILNDLIDSH